MLDLSNKIESSLFIQSQEWKPQDLNELMRKIEVLSYAALGSGLIEFWEWKEVQDKLLTNRNAQNSISLRRLEKIPV